MKKHYEISFENDMGDMDRLVVTAEEVVANRKEIFITADGLEMNLSGPINYCVEMSEKNYQDWLSICKHYRSDSFAIDVSPL